MQDPELEAIWERRRARRYVNDHGRPIDEHGNLIAGTMGMGSEPYCAFDVARRQLNKRMLQNHLRDPTPAQVIARLEALLEPITDAGEREECEEELRDLRELQEKGNEPRPRRSDAFYEGMRAVSSTDHTEGTLPDRLAQAQQAQRDLSAAIKKAEAADAYEDAQILRRRAPGLMRYVIALSDALDREEGRPPRTGFPHHLFDQADTPEAE